MFEADKQQADASEMDLAVGYSSSQQPSQHTVKKV